MKKIKINKIDETIYHETLDNGLNIYVYPTNKTNEYYISFFTKYGSVYNDFKFKEDKNFKEYPKGIAHFLEHKLFESDGEDVFEYFSKNGSYCNAFTSYYVTNYIASGKENFKNDLEFLINFVQDPFITNENVEKEKGIIEQELNMYMDEPYYALTEICKYNLINTHTARFDIGGKVSDIKSITKEMLDDCYKTFYSPNNMNIVVSGNINVDETINIIRNNQSKKNIENVDFELMTYNETKEVYKKEERVYMDIEIPLLSVGLKLFRPQNIEKNIFEYYVSSILFENFNNISDFYINNLKDKKLLSPIGIMISSFEDFVIVTLNMETNTPDIMKDNTIDKLNNMNISESFFERFKKKEISKIMYFTEKHKGINDFILESIVEYGHIKENIIDEISMLTYEELNNIFNKLDFNNVNSVIIEKNDKK